MEIYVSGPGVSIAARGIGLERYTYWSRRSEKDLFDYSWNIPGRNRMNVPDDVDFLEDKAFNDPGNWVINACDYELADIWVEDDGVINKYRSDHIPHVKHVLVKFKPELRTLKSINREHWQAEYAFYSIENINKLSPPINHHSHRYYFYTAF